MTSTRRTFLTHSALMFASAYAAPWRGLLAADGESPVADTAFGKVRGTMVDGIQIFKGIPYGGTTAGKRSLPKTASPLSVMGLLGGLSLLAAGGLTMRRRRLHRG